MPAGQYCTEPVGCLDDHLDWMVRCGRSARTIAGRRIELTRLGEWLGHDPATATAAELERWQAGMSSTDSMRWRASMVRPYYKWLRARGVRPDDPAALLPIPRRPRRLPRPIPEPALLAAVAAASVRLRPWLLLAGWSGLRAAEIAGLEVEAFSTDPAGQTWVRVVGKGNAERVVPVPGWAWVQIAPVLPASGPCWRRERGSGPVTGKHVSIRCNRYLAKRADVPRWCTFHSLRHRFATRLLAGTKDVRLVQHAMGHADLSVLHVYTQVMSAAAAAAVDALPGLPPAMS
ncbi:MAG: tyrosine-type recombinase/integrase [Pseudonocardia sp.]|nr:tyrosine-type recombinase/integrase [Pseudonocardia sp.]